MRPFSYGFFRKTAYGWNHQINCLLFTLNIINPQNYYQNVWIRYDISLAIKKIVMNVTYEYIMTSSDQNLWIFSRLNDPIYSTKLILIMLTYILLLQLLRQSVHPLSATGGWASNQIFKNGVLTGPNF